MVYAFVFGIFLGLPIGCYLREAGYAKKFQTAYSVFFPDTGVMKSDSYKNRSKEFFESLKRGEVDNKDFERYIYGSSHNQRTTDEQDRNAEMER